MHRGKCKFKFLGRRRRKWAEDMYVFQCPDKDCLKIQYTPVAWFWTGK